MDADHEPLSKPELRVALLLVVAAAVVLAGAIWSVPIWLGNDAPSHLFSAYASAHFHDEARAFARYFEPNRPLSARGFLEVYRVFDAWLPWQLAYRAALVLIAELWAGAFLFAAVALDPRRWPHGLAGFALALGWAFDLGLFSYWMASAGLFLVVGAALLWGERRWLPVLLALLLYLLACAHVFPAIVAGGALVVLEVARRRGRERWRRLALVCLAGVPAAALALLSSATAQRLDGESAQWGALTERITNLVACTLSGPWWRWLPAALLAAASIALLIERRKSVRDVDAALGGLGLVLLSLAVATPLHLRWMFFAPRFAPLGLALVVLVLPSERLRPRLRALLALGVATWVVAACWWSADVHGRLAERTRPLLELLESLPPAPARRLTIAMPLPDEGGEGIRYLEPLRQVGQLVALELGGMNLYGLVGAPAIHPLLLRPEVVADLHVPPVDWLEHFDPHAGPKRQAQLTRVLAASTELDEVVLLGAEDDLGQLIAAGYRVRARAPGVALARFEGCGGQVVAEGAAGAPVALELGWWPLRDPSQGVEGTLEATGSLSWQVEGLSCDELWVRPRGGRCANGDADGYLRGRLGERPLRCALPPATE